MQAGDTAFFSKQAIAQHALVVDNNARAACRSGDDKCFRKGHPARQLHGATPIVIGLIDQNIIAAIHKTASLRLQDKRPARRGHHMDHVNNPAAIFPSGNARGCSICAARLFRSDLSVSASTDTRNQPENR